MPGFFSFTHGFGSPSRFIIVIDSTPPPIAASACPMTIWCAAIAMACSPEEQKRLTVVPATVMGRPARTSATRATLLPCGPFGWAQPRITSSISLGSSCGALPSTSLMQWAARSSGRVMLNDPRWDLASGVRELATTTASLMGAPFSRRKTAGEYTSALDRGHPRRGASTDCLVADVLATHGGRGRPAASMAPAAVEKPPAGIPVAVRVGSHREADHRADLRAEPPGLRRGQGGRLALRSDARLIEHFVSDPVADAGREGLVEQHRFDRRVSLAEHRVEARGRGQGAPRVEAEHADGRLGGRVAPKADAAEPPAVGQGQLAAAREAQVELGEARRPVWSIDVSVGHQTHRTPCRQVNAAGHAEVQTRPRPPVQLEPEMLAVAPHRLHTAAD